jgi:hypothetical protein
MQIPGSDAGCQAKQIHVGVLEGLNPSAASNFLASPSWKSLRVPDSSGLCEGE